MIPPENSAKLTLLIRPERSMFYDPRNPVPNVDYIALTPAEIAALNNFRGNIYEPIYEQGEPLKLLESPFITTISYDNGVLPQKRKLACRMQEPRRKRIKREVKIEPSDPDFVPLPFEPNLSTTALPPPIQGNFTSVEYRRRRRKRKTPRKPPTKVTGRPVDKRLRMHCSHCRRDFWAKPTCREGRYVLNHKCSDQPRRQYVVGGWHRKCNLNHFAPCIDFVAQGNEQDD